MTKARVGVVGVGRFGQHHVRAYRHLSNCELVGIYDIDEERGRFIAEKNDTTCFKSYESLLENVDTISVVTPTVTHFDVACMPLERGINTLIEKPVAVTLKEADDLIELAQANGVNLAVGLLERFNPAFLKATQKFDKLQYFKAERFGKWVGRKVTVDVVVDLMIHDLDLLTLLDNSSIVKIDAFGKKILSPHNDIANVRIKLESGAVAVMESNRTSDRKNREIQLYSDDETVFIDMLNQTARRSRIEHQTEEGEVSYEEITVSKSDQLSQELKAFLNMSNVKKRRIANGVEAKKALEMAMMVNEAIRS